MLNLMGDFCSKAAPSSNFALNAFLLKTLAQCHNGFGSGSVVMGLDLMWNLQKGMWFLCLCVFLCLAF